MRKHFTYKIVSVVAKELSLLGWGVEPEIFCHRIFFFCWFFKFILKITDRNKFTV